MAPRSKLSTLCGFVKGKTVTAEFKSTFKSLVAPVDNNDKHSAKKPSRIVMAQKRTSLLVICWLNYWFVLDILFNPASVDLEFDSSVLLGVWKLKLFVTYD